MKFKISLKVGNKFQHWQYKIAQTHEAILLVRMELLLNKMCLLLGYDYTDRNTIYHVSMSDETFEGSQICLRRMDNVPMEADARSDHYYSVETSSIGEFRAEPLVPEFFNTRYFKCWPERIYFKLEKVVSSEIVN